MLTRAVSWRRAVVGLSAVALGLTATVAALRSDGFTAVDATVPRATRWFIDSSTGRAVLADGFAGRTIARLKVGSPGDVLDIAQSATRAVVLDRTEATTRSIDWATFAVGPPQTLGLGTSADTVIGVGQPGVIAVDPTTTEAVLVPPEGEPQRFAAPAAVGDGNTRVAPDGAVWTLAGGRVTRTTTVAPEVYAADLDAAKMTLVGNLAMVYDGATNRVRLGGGSWVELPGDVEPSELVVQEPGPTAGCGWLATGARLWCVSGDGIEHSAEIDGLRAGGADQLAIAGDAAALVDRPTGAIQRLDWRAGRVLDDAAAFVDRDARLNVAASVDLVWIEEAQGDLIWAVTPWGLNPMHKDDDTAPLMGESGELIDDGSGGAGGAVDQEQADELEREPDDNGFDDPPVAVDDPVTARTGASVTVPVTANDYDPDGEAVAVVDYGEPARGRVEITSASTVVYYPDPGFVGTDRFDYTISDEFGHEANATVHLTLLDVNAPNSAPLGRADSATTGPDVEVIIDVLLNDVDPERDSLRIGSFTPADIGGEVFEDRSLTGFPALRYVPPAGSSGKATFTYRPMDSFGAEGDPVPVTVEIAQPGDPNRAPIAQPDAVRVRRNAPPTDVQVLTNDRDPDGDRLTLTLRDPEPEGLGLRVTGQRIEVTARAGVRERVRFAYTITDEHGEQATGNVLVVVVGEEEPNRAPVAAADTATAVVGQTTSIQVLSNDSDPDNDPLILVDAQPSGESASAGAVRVVDDRVEYTPASLTSDEPVDDRFTYRISDGHGHQATGTVAVRVLTEEVKAPPFARDDIATTIVDTPVTIDVLRNDGDPSGQQPRLVGDPGCPAGGTAERTDANRVRFTPPPGKVGEYRCTYEVANRQGSTDHADIIVTVFDPPNANQPPTVIGETAVLRFGETRPFAVLENDTDDGPRGALRVSSSTTPIAGTATRNGDIITFTAPRFATEVVISYTVADAQGGTGTGNIVIRVLPPEPKPPIAVDDVDAVRGPLTSRTVPVTLNDSDPDGDPALLSVASASVVSGPATATYGATTVRVALTDPGYVGTIAVNYTVADRDGLTDVGTLVLDVLPPLNRPPVAVPDIEEVVNGGVVEVPIGLNDSDPDGDVLAFQITRSPDSTLGTASLSGSTLTFRARPGAPSGVAEVGYRISDGEFTADTTVRIAVQACAVAPPGAPDLFFETGYQQPIAIDLTERASNGTVTDVGAPLGAASGVYTPPEGMNGNVTFNYQVRNSCGIVATGTVTIDVNQPPVGTPVALTIGRHEQVSVPISQLASDDEALTITAVPGQPDWVTVPAGGQSLQINPAGRTGTVAFTAVISDPGGLTVDVPVTIELVNQAPVGQPDSARLPTGAGTVNVLGNDADPDGDAISILAYPAQVTFPNGAVASLTAAGSAIDVVARDAAGTATFVYTIADAYGAVSGEIPVTITVNGAPRASDFTIDVPADGSATVAAPVSDPDGDALQLTVAEPPAGSGWAVSVNGLSITAVDVSSLQPSPPPLVLEYTVVDPDGRTATARVTLNALPEPTTTTTTTTTTLPPPTTVPPATTTTLAPPPGSGPPGGGPPGG